VVECSWPWRVYGKPTLLAAVISFLTAAPAAALGKEAAAVVVAVGFAGYLLLSVFESSWRLPFLASAVSAHIASVILYYSNPLPLPFAIIERSSHGVAIDIDIVQLLVVIEAASVIASSPPRECVEEGREAGKAIEGAAPESEGGEAAANAPEGGGDEAARQAPQGQPSSGGES